MFFQDDGAEDFELLTKALQALASIPNPDVKWMKTNSKIYSHALKVTEEDKRMHAEGWSGSNGNYSRPATK